MQYSRQMGRFRYGNEGWARAARPNARPRGAARTMTRSKTKLCVPAARLDDTMRYTNLGLMALLVLVMIGTVAAAPVASTCKGNFTANMSFGPAKGDGKKSGMTFEGKLQWAKPKLRLDMTEKNTKESMIVLVDFTADSATLLYPDTLNGMKTNLSALDTSGYLKQLEPLLSSQGAALPKGWKRTKAGSGKIDGKAVTKYDVTGPAGEKVQWWVDAKDQPVKVQTGKGNATATLNFSSLSFGAEVPAKAFTYDKGYSVVDFNAGKAKSAKGS
jgi:outer membrane lipoprotein-sorting protein